MKNYILSFAVWGKASELEKFRTGKDDKDIFCSRTSRKSTQAFHGKIVRLIRLLFVLVFATFDTGRVINNFVNGIDNSTRYCKGSLLIPV